MRNIQKQVWVIEFDADKIPYNSVDERLKMLDGVLKCDPVPVGKELSRLVSETEDLERASKKFRESAQEFKEYFDPMKCDEIEKRYPKK